MMMRKNPIIAIANPVDIVAEAAKAVKAAKAAAIAAHALEVAGVLVHFDTAYDFKTNRLTAFQQLCVDLDVEVGTSLTQCKKVTRFSSPSPTNHMLTICCRTSRKLASTSSTSSTCSRLGAATSAPSGIPRRQSSVATCRRILTGGSRSRRRRRMSCSRRC
jgi:hypothetical protein